MIPYIFITKVSIAYESKYFLIGFKRIEGLEKYFNLKSIWLECNGITKIENLGHLTKLRMM